MRSKKQRSQGQASSACRVVSTPIGPPNKMRPRRSCQPIVDQDKDAAADNDRQNDECHYARRKLISLKTIRHLKLQEKDKPVSRNALGRHSWLCGMAWKPCVKSDPRLNIVWQVLVPHGGSRTNPKTRTVKPPPNKSLQRRRLSHARRSDNDQVIKRCDRVGFIPLSPCGANSLNSVHSATSEKAAWPCQSMPCLG